MSWLLNFIYVLLLGLASPVLLWRRLRNGRYRRGWAEKLTGTLPTFSPSDRVIWFHAVSVGEVLQLVPLINSLAARHQGKMLVTTSTDTGFDLAVKKFPDHCVGWFPLDFSWAVGRALKRVQPSQVVLVELELWPNFLRTCHRNEVPVSIVNARLSERSHRGYARIRPLISPLLNPLRCVAAQNEAYAARFRDLGTASEATVVTGSIKFDGAETDRRNPATMALRNLFDIRDDQLVFIAGSTQDPEEKMALAAWESARTRCPGLRLIVVPRHPERFADVASLLETSGHSFSKRSTLSGDRRQNPADIILLDTIGELTACWGLADVALVGGSFGSRGGQNMLEPAAYGSPVMFGPKTRNFKDIVAGLLQAEAAIQLAGPEDLPSTLIELLGDCDRRAELGRRAQEFVKSHAGAVARTANLLLPDAENARNAA